MKVDLYLKIVLTVIALSLVFQCIQDTVHPKVAKADGPQAVVLVGIDCHIGPCNPGWGNIPVVVANVPLFVRQISPMELKAQKNSALKPK